jgi:NAD(P)-dependent dehydrogenase (short-subunit alcohol dehydrogenase family)
VTGSPFAGRVAVVTGGSSGIGAAVASALADGGASVARLSPDRPVQGSWWECDVRDGRSVDDAVGEVARQLGEVSLLVCAAGIVSEAPLDRLGTDEFRDVVDVALTGTFHAARAAVPSMRRAGGGAVVAYSSGYATSGYPHGSHYAAAKAGVEGLVKSLARELAPTIRVNAVAPGPVDTPMLDHIDDRDAWQADREARIPMGRIAITDDVVGPTLFLLGPAAGYVTGQVLHVNGGLLMP